MGIMVVCKSCGNRRTVPSHLYDEKIRGRVVKIACKACKAMISVDGTVPPPPVAEAATSPGTPTTEDPISLVIPALGRLPREHEPSGNEAKAPPREKQISHVDGPISER